MRLTGEDIQTLTAALESTPYAEFHVESGGYSLVLRRTAGCWSAEATVLTGAPAGTEAAAADEADYRDEGLVIRSPLVGVFYRAPKPGAPPFVEDGSIVTPETVVGITETMKLMNSVHAGVSGRITHIAAADASFVEAGQVLMHVEEVAP